MRRATRLLFALGLCAAALFVAPGSASAHPLGNFTINLYGGIVVESGRLQVNYVMDMAEIPTFQEMHLIDINGDGRADRSELARYAARKSVDLAPGVVVTSGGRRIPLHVSSSAARLRPGQGGLPILRLQAVLRGPLPRAGELVLLDPSSLGRL